MHSFNYKNNEASKDEILNHLKSCDELFNPRLSASVDIPVYAQKIKNNAATFEAWHNNELVGLIACYLNDINKLQGHITNVSILKEYQGKGISKQLLAQTILKGKELGFKTLSLDVEVSNKKAISLYQKCGFDLTGRNGSKYNMINRLNENRNVLVSICCITYNHENFIEAALNGFLLQKTNFPIEILVHDDASEDNTANIIREYEKKNPEIIKPILQTENQFSQKVDIISEYQLPRARGKYIAMCEGDDYWTDPYKLQKQVDILEANPDYAFIHTDYDYLVQKTGKIVKNIHKYDSINNLSGNVFDYTFNNTHIRTLTVCYRKDKLMECDEIFKLSIEKGWVGSDMQAYLFLSGKYPIAYLPESTGIYRRLQESVSISQDNNKMLDFVRSHFEIRLYILNYFKKDTRNYQIILSEILNRTLKLAFYTRNKMLFHKYYKLGKEKNLRFKKINNIYKMSIANFLFYPVIIILKIIFKMKNIANGSKRIL